MRSPLSGFSMMLVSSVMAASRDGQRDDAANVMTRPT
jgi:hypothetical protein